MLHVQWVWSSGQFGVIYQLCPPSYQNRLHCFSPHLPHTHPPMKTESSYSQSSALKVKRRVGEAVFELAFMRKEKKLTPRQMQILRDGEKWVIHHYEDDNWGQVFSSMECCYAKQIWIDFCSSSSIPRDIANVDFTRLLQLHLCNCLST